MSRLILAEAPGQLGNQLFLFAHLIAFGKEFGLPVYNAPFQRYREHFRGTLTGAIPNFQPAHHSEQASRLAVKHSERACRAVNLIGRSVRKSYSESGRIFAHITCKGDSPEYDIDLASSDFRRTIELAKATFLFGWRFRNYQLLKIHEDVIRYHLDFEEVDPVRNYLNNLRRSSDFILTVHVRRGDYRDFMGGRYYIDISDYALAARHVAEQLGLDQTVVVVCSNEKPDLGFFKGMRVVRGPGTIIGDMQTMALSDYIVAPPSTYSRWASFMGRVPLGYIERSNLLLNIDTLEAAGR